MFNRRKLKLEDLTVENVKELLNEVAEKEQKARAKFNAEREAALAPAIQKLQEIEESKRLRAVEVKKLKAQLESLVAQQQELTEQLVLKVNEADSSKLDSQLKTLMTEKLLIEAKIKAYESATQLHLNKENAKIILNSMNKHDELAYEGMDYGVFKEIGKLFIRAAENKAKLPMDVHREIKAEDKLGKHQFFYGAISEETVKHLESFRISSTNKLKGFLTQWIHVSKHESFEKYVKEQYSNRK